MLAVFAMAIYKYLVGPVKNENNNEFLNPISRGRQEP